MMQKKKDLRFLLSAALAQRQCIHLWSECKINEANIAFMPNFLMILYCPFQSLLGLRPFHEHKDCGTESDPTCLRVKDGHLFAEAYNCDFDKSPKPEWSERAKKQLYQPEYVLTHFVHYATVTKGLMTTKEEAKKMGKSWYMTFHESHSADRITDEINQAVMLHSKTTVPEYTVDWKRRCAVDFKPGHGENCRVGFPWPRNDDKSTVKATSDGFGYNCFQNEKLNEVWLPKLRNAMEIRQSKLDGLR